MKAFLLFMFFLYLIIGLTKFVTIYARRFSVDAKTKVVCQQMAEQNREAYKNTEFATMDFYTSCIDNIRYDSPLMR